MRILLIVFTLAVAAAFAAPAGAATVSSTFVLFQEGDKYASSSTVYRLDVADTVGENNAIVIEGGRVRATAGSLTSGPGCSLAAPGEVVCALTPREEGGDVSTRIVVDLGGGDDQITSRMEASLRGGAGDDRLVLDGVGGRLDGGPGADLLAGPVPAPGEAGGPFVSVDYGQRTEGVRVTPDAGGADDGSAGEGDEVTGRISEILGGSGSDGSPGGSTSLVGGDGHDRLVAGAGGYLSGGPGADVLVGGAGNERLDGGLGPDVLRGGGGTDTAEFSGAPGPVRVTLDDRPDDGAVGEGDDIGSDVEDVEGTPGDDVLVGSPAANELNGNAGNDRIDGGPGDDRLDGNAGFDVVRGGPGADYVTGGSDEVAFQPRSDDLDGGPGPDTISAMGADDVMARDGEPDVIDCGPVFAGHHGKLIADDADRAKACAPRMRWSSNGRLDRRGRVLFVVTCPPTSAVRCQGKVRLWENRGRVGSAPVDVAAGGRQSVRVRVTPRVLSRIRRSRKGREVGVVVETVRRSPRSVLDAPDMLNRIRLRVRR